nr:unnamed protein product [Digitaria exilis]
MLEASDKDGKVSQLEHVFIRGSRVRAKDQLLEMAVVALLQCVLRNVNITFLDDFFSFHCFIVFHFWYFFLVLLLIFNIGLTVVVKAVLLWVPDNGYER